MQGAVAKGGHMASVKTLQDLFMNELRQIIGAEQQLVKALPILAEAATAAELRQAFRSHLEETETHVERLQQVFDLFGEKPTPETSDAIASIVDESRDLIDVAVDDAVRDAGLIAAAQ